LVRQQMRYRGREQHEESSLLECEPMPRPGKGLRRHRRPLYLLHAHAPRRL